MLMIPTFQILKYEFSQFKSEEKASASNNERWVCVNVCVCVCVWVCMHVCVYLGWRVV